jgi:hypothetical protein
MHSFALPGNGADHLKPTKTERLNKGEPETGNTSAPKKTTGVQGEGDYASARKFDEAEKEFVASGKVPAAARAAAPKSEAEQKEMLDAEEAGKRRARK